MEDVGQISAIICKTCKKEFLDWSCDHCYTQYLLGKMEK